MVGEVVISHSSRSSSYLQSEFGSFSVPLANDLGGEPTATTTMGVFIPSSRPASQMNDFCQRHEYDFASPLSFSFSPQRTIPNCGPTADFFLLRPVIPLAFTLLSGDRERKAVEAPRGCGGLLFARVTLPSAPRLTAQMLGKSETGASAATEMNWMSCRRMAERVETPGR